MEDQPLGASDVKIDVVTGKPFTSGEAPMEPEGFGQEEREEEKRRRQKTISQGDQLINELAGTGGVVILEVMQLYIKRLDELSQNDPECRAYTKMLSALQIKLNIAEKAIKMDIKDLLKYAAPEGDTRKK